jgi:solute carrier family 30 (zinc transporter), member 9
VHTAIVANVLIMLVKFGAFGFTKSGAMLSEAIHSLADVGNQALLAVGIQKSERPADEKHPYGYGREQFVWALIAGVGIFFLGCGVTVYHGIELLLHPAQVEHMSVAMVVLGVSFAAEAMSWSVAMGAVRKNARALGFSVWDFLVKGPDPMAVAVVLEDTAALVGLTLAFGGVVVTAASGLLVFDAISTILIGLLLGGIACFIIYKNKGYLVGRRMQLDQEAAVRRILTSDPVVEGVFRTRSIVLGPDSARFKADVNFNGRVVARKLLEGRDIDALRASLDSAQAFQSFAEEFGEQVVEALGDEIDRLERAIQAEVPSVRHVDLETE